MKRALLFFALLSYAQIFFAQAEDLCSGDRLVEPIFNEVQVTQDVKFDEGNSNLDLDIDLVMDIYEPVGDNLERRPVVVMAHGGSFIFGSRRNEVMIETCTELAKRGYVAASIEYSLFPFLIFGTPDSTDLINIITKAMGETKSAIRFFREDGLGDNNYRVDPDLISVGGYSAGAILACHQGMLDETDVLADFVQDAVDEQGGFENLGNRLEVSDKVLSIFNMSGSIYDLDYIDENSAPIFSSHGTLDETVPFRYNLTGDIMYSHGSGNIEDRYESLGYESELFTFEGGGHTDIFMAAQFQDDLIQMYDDFFAWNKDQICGTISSNRELVSSPVSIFPNPTDGELNFKFSKDLDSEYRIDLFNQLGQVVYSSISFVNSAAQIHVPELNHGVYFARVSFEQNYQPITRRIIVGE